jgi:ribose 5-phosphate isomerase A
MTSEQQKRAAAAEALRLVENGMRLGLGTGSTAKHFVDLLGARVAAGLDVICVPTSEATAAQAGALGIRLATLDEVPELDLTVDGADEIDPALDLIKGGGAALLREKIVAFASRSMAVIADGSKTVARLGRFPLPVEVNAFGLAATQRAVASVCGDADGSRTRLRLRLDGKPLVTDGGHLILDLHLGAIQDARALGAALHAIPGVVEHGLFIGLCERALIAGEHGVAVRHRTA